MLFSQTLPLAFSDEGTGQTFLLLHGGAGPASMAGLGAILSPGARVVTPTYPGFNGEPRPDWFTRIDDLVLAHLALIEQLQLSNVVVVGNSVGGWIAAEIALRKSPQIAAIVLLNAVGIDGGSPERAIVNPMGLAPAERGAYSFHDPARFALAPSGPEAAKVMSDNQAALRVYAGEPFMHHPTLRSRLAQVSVPTLVVWGKSDRIVNADYGQLYADSIPGARFELVAEAGHFPQIERPDEVVRLIRGFAGGFER